MSPIRSALLLSTLGLLLTSAGSAPGATLPRARQFRGDGRAAEPSSAGIPALFSFGDADGDGRMELAAVDGEGRLQLFTDAGGGRFEDVSERTGLAAVGDAALALWGDYDGDGRLDLFVGARSGASRLFHNDGGQFSDRSATSGLALAGAVESARWLDHDGDGRLDLFVVGQGTSALQVTLFRGLEGGFFEESVLPVTGSAEVLRPGEPVVVAGGAAPGAEGAPSAPRAPGTPGTRETAGRPIGREVSLDGGTVGGRIAVAPTITTVIPLVADNCASTVFDQANPGTCLHASSTPALGKLYPLSGNLFVAVGGNVGVGTTSPSARLHVAGTARVTDTLTLAPSGDTALDVSTGSIYKGGALFIHTRGGSFNTAVGRQALTSVSSGFYNTATGDQALLGDTTGFCNTASGFRALSANTSGTFNVAVGASTLFANTTGVFNTACGNESLYTNTTGSYNTACGNRALIVNSIGARNTAAGSGALYANTTGSNNTACGYRALTNNSTGARNTAFGNLAGSSLTTGNDNIDVGNPGVAGESATIRVGTAGTHTRAFLAGVRGVTTANANAIPVLVDSAGQLGTISSSRRFKQDIEDMGERTRKLLELRPVVFRYKQAQTLPGGGELPLEYGLIAEEVAEVFPDLVVYDDEGQPFTVKYHLLSAMLLNELEQQARELAELRGSFEARLAALEAAR